MNINEDILDDEDYFYGGLDRLRFLSCRCCARYSPFLFHLPPNEMFGLQESKLTVCPGCLPSPNELRKYCLPINDGSVFDNNCLLELLKGFEYSNPFYRKFALTDRVLLTIDTRVDQEPVNICKSLSHSLKLKKLQNLFPDVHRVENKQFWGLQEIGEVLTVKIQDICKYYANHRKDKLETAVQCDSIVPKPQIQHECHQEPSWSSLGVPRSSCTFVKEKEYSRDGKRKETHLQADVELSVYPLEYGQEPPKECDAPLIQQLSQDPSSTISSCPTTYTAVDPKFKLKILRSDSEYSCDICLLAEKNSLKYGDFIEKQQQRCVLRCHYFCLLSGTHILQQGLDTSGILGFLLSDINKSFKEYRSNICSYCGHRSAAIKCSSSECTRWFHYICGHKNNCMTQFSGDMISFCHEHHPVRHSTFHDKNEPCWICWEPISDYHPVSSVCSVCDPEEGSENLEQEIHWFHRECLQRFAIESGYYFKCPICYDKNYVHYARQHGIFVPMRDASWELEPGAFKDIHMNKCTAIYCKLEKVSCQGGQRALMVGCKACGGETIHIACAEIDDPSEYVCSKCMDATFIKLI